MGLFSSVTLIYMSVLVLIPQSSSSSLHACFVLSFEISTVSSPDFSFFHNCFSHSGSLAVPFQFQNHLGNFYKGINWDSDKDYIESMDNLGSIQSLTLRYFSIYLDLSFLSVLQFQSVNFVLLLLFLPQDFIHFDTIINRIFQVCFSNIYKKQVFPIVNMMVFPFPFLFIASLMKLLCGCLFIQYPATLAFCCCS